MGDPSGGVDVAASVGVGQRGEPVDRAELALRRATGDGADDVIAPEDEGGGQDRGEMLGRRVQAVCLASERVDDDVELVGGGAVLTGEEEQVRDVQVLRRVVQRIRTEGLDRLQQELLPARLTEGSTGPSDRFETGPCAGAAGERLLGLAELALDDTAWREERVEGCRRAGPSRPPEVRGGR